MSSFIQSLLTHSALLTLSQITPNLLSSHLIQNSNLKKSNSFSPSSLELDSNHSTTIEQLSASTIPLPITSISTIWRILNCIEWINLKKNHIKPSTTSPPQTQSHLDPLNQDDLIHNFDLSNTLQHVGDILAPIIAESDVELVFHQFFYPPQPEQSELQSFNSSLQPDLPPSSESNSSNQINPSPLPPSDIQNVYLANVLDGEANLRQVWVRADENGLIIGLVCLLRQILSHAKSSYSAIEVGLHLTPLHAQSQSLPKPTSDHSIPSDSTFTRWKCVFDVSLTAPPPLGHPNPKQHQDTPSTLQDSSSTTIDQSTNSKSDPPVLHAIITEPTKLGRLRISSNQNSQLPLCPEDSLSKTIFEKSLGMKLSTGRLTSSGHSWKVTGIFEKSSIHHSHEPPSQQSHLSSSQTSNNYPSSSLPSSEPTVQELTKFAEAALKGQKAVFFAAEQSVFAKHITTYLTSWNIDVSHMPYEGVTFESSNPVDPLADRKPSTTSNYTRKSSNSLLEPPSVPVIFNPTSSHSSNTSIRPNNFIIIDDHIPTLKVQLLKLRPSSLSSLLMPANPLSKSNQTSQRPPLSRRMKSLTQVDRFEGSQKPSNTSLIYFTSISNLRLVQDIIRNHLIATQWSSIPDVLVIPKPIGHRRILTALHTALNQPLIEPPIIPIATSPSSPGTPHHLTPHSHPSVTSQLSRVSHYRDVNDLDPTPPNHHLDDSNRASISGPEILNSTWPAPSQNSTPPGLRTPGTAPGTPGVPSPALLSHEALEYFSKAATENGGSSSTGVVLQSPDGRPQAMFFHHSGSSNRPKNEVGGHLSNSNLNVFSKSRSNSGNLRNASRSSSLNRSMMRHVIDSDPDPSPLTLAQHLMTDAKDNLSRTQSSSSSSSVSNSRLNDSGQSETSPTLPVDKHPLNQTIRSSNPRNNQILGQPPTDTVFPHAMALAQYEAISPKTPTLTYPEGLYASTLSQRRANSVSSCQSNILTPTHSDHSIAPITPNAPQTYNGLSPLTKEQQQILLNPRPLPMLRMPSIPVSLPRSISVALPPPRQTQIAKLTPTSENLPESRSKSCDLPPSSNLPPHHVTNETKPSLDESIDSNQRNIALTKSTSALLEASRRRSSAGDPIISSRLANKRRISRKPTTALVPPINVLIVEDNRINQTILTTFMRKKSVKFDVAMNGQEAVDKWRNGSFHLVLMDLQLPVKDGIEATKEIREAERAANINAFANTPPAVGGNTPPVLLGSSCSSGGSRATPHNVSVIIVALTASSLDVDREVALAAGCNDFLTKPVSLAWLEKKLLEWGSMAWLSGFSRAKVLSFGNNSSRLLNQSLPAAFSSNSIGLGVTLSATPSSLPPPSNSASQSVSFTDTLAQRKAKQVADHLHLRSDKVRAAEDRKRAYLNKGKTIIHDGSVLSSENRNCNQHTEVKTTEGSEVNEEDKMNKVHKASEDESFCSSKSSHKLHNLNSTTEEDTLSTDSNRSESLMHRQDQPQISLQIPTPEILDSSFSDIDAELDERLETNSKNVEQKNQSGQLIVSSHDHQISIEFSSNLSDTHTSDTSIARPATNPALESLPSDNTLLTSSPSESTFPD